MANKNSFVLQTRLNAVVAKLSDKQAGVLFKGILDYAANGAVANFEDSAVGIAFEFVRQDLDYTAKKYAETCAKRAESGKQGGLAKVANASKCYQTLAKASKAKHNDNEDDNELVDKSTNLKEKYKKEKSSSKFIKPTLEQVSAYCKERNNTVNAQAFVDYYASKGWKIGNAPMKDWQAAVRTWERRETSAGGTGNGTDYNRNPEPNKYAGFGRKIEG